MATRERSARAIAAAGSTGADGDLGGVGQDRVGPVGLTGQQIADPLQQLGRGPLAARTELVEGGLGIGPHPVHPIAAQQRPQQRPIALDRAAVWERPGHRSLFGRVGPALGRDRLTDQRLQPGPEHGHRRVASEQALVLEPAEPAAGGVDPVRRRTRAGPASRPAARPGRCPRRPGRGQSRSPAGRWPHTRKPPGRAAPGPVRAHAGEVRRGAAPGTGDGSGTSGAGGRGDQQQVGLLQPGKDSAGSNGVQDRIAQRAGHTLQHRRAGQERHRSGGSWPRNSDHR